MHGSSSLPRRNFLRASACATALSTLALSQNQFCSARDGISLEPPMAGEDVLAYIRRMRGGHDETLYKQILGAANEFKEGDAIVGVAAIDEMTRQHARTLLNRTRLIDINQHAPHRDGLAEYIWPVRLANKNAEPNTSERNSKLGQLSLEQATLGQLCQWLLSANEADIHSIKDELSSDVIACVVKCMNNQQLIALSSKLFNPLPGSTIGARGRLGARIQPNSPTDDVEDIRWQVFDGFAYAVGDVLLGTNPVSSNPEAVLAVEQTLQDVLETFGIDHFMPHCVLTHIDIQAQVERDHPGSTALWFQSIAGNDAANATFDVTIEKLLQHARSRTGPFALYFETGQGADFTNGHDDGCDMVLLEARKYGLARSLSHEVARRNGRPAWVHVNDVAGFIGPEVFRTKEQLVRCCLEDLVMGKLHGLTIGLDVCSTLHMDVGLADLDWCLDKIAPAAPAYLMALPTKIDPMLGYLTTGYQDHVRLREKYGYRVSDQMHKFFTELEIIDADGKPTEHFGDPLWVYAQYRKRKGDTRTSQELKQEGEAQLKRIQQRGVFIARGFDGSPGQLSKSLAIQIEKITDDARKCIWEQWQDDFVSRIPGQVRLATLSHDRTDYILHPDSGERLSSSAIATLQSLRSQHAGQYSGQIVISEGLNALALMDEGQLLPLLAAIERETKSLGMNLAPQNLVVSSGRVRAGYRIGETLFGGLPAARTILHIIGERPGSGHHTLSVYITRADGSRWGQAGLVDHNITQVVSGIAITALRPEKAAAEIRRILV